MCAHVKMDENMVLTSYHHHDESKKNKITWASRGFPFFLMTFACLGLYASLF